jgi:hypothetical protein
MVRPKIEFLTKISGHQLIKNGDWETHLNGHLVCLRPEQNLVKLYVDGMLQQTSWAIESIPIKGDISYRGGRIPWDRAETHYIVSNGRRFRHRYLDREKYTIGTRVYHNAAYSIQFLTSSKWRYHRKRKIAWLEARYLNREKRREQRRRRLERREMSLK